MHCNTGLHCLLLLISLLLIDRTDSLPLSTSGRWIVDAVSGRRVKLRCANWASHMPAVLSEGLDKSPLDAITARAASLGFNCVRLTWATRLFTDQKYGNLTVAQSLSSLGLERAVEGVRRNNPTMMGLTVREAYDAVVKSVGKAGIMAVLDNHVSKPQWCCGADDGNGFFGDLYFDTEEWLLGLQTVAARYINYPQVVGMSMRNELRGPNQTEPEWYRNVNRGASAIHAANPNVLVIISGLSYDTDLSFLTRRPITARFGGKLVLEAHWYAFSDRQKSEWSDGHPNRVCADSVRRFDHRAGFVAGGDQAGAVPLFVSEFGVDQRGVNRADNRFLSCFLAFAAQRDVDWAVWALQGSYYIRDGQPGFEEAYGVLDAGWEQPKNPKFQERFQLVQEMLQDPGSSDPSAVHQFIYHPESGRCVWVDDDNNVLLGDCKKRGRWSHAENGMPIRLAGTRFCLLMVGEEIPIGLSTECDDSRSAWRMALDYQLVAGLDSKGRQLCLERDSANSSAIVTRQCLCLNGTACSENSQIQWFMFITSNIV